jgi:hypothetical protein
MNPHKPAKNRTQKPHTRVGGSIPSRATSSPTKRAAGKPGKNTDEAAQLAEDFSIGTLGSLMRLKGFSELRIWLVDEKRAAFEFTEKAAQDAVFAEAKAELEAMGAKPVFEVGAPYIVNHTDAPDLNRIVICTHPDGRCRYLCIRDNRRWPHVMQLSERSTPLAQFGVVITMPSAFVLMLEQVADSQAVYADEKRRRWQEPSRICRLKMYPENPEYWRMDVREVPKLVAWVEKYPTAQAQFERILRPWTCEKCQTSAETPSLEDVA